MPFEVPYKFVLWRALYAFYQKNRDYDPIRFYQLKNLYSDFGISEEEKDLFVRLVLYRHVLVVPDVHQTVSHLTGQETQTQMYLVHIVFYLTLLVQRVPIVPQPQLVVIGFFVWSIQTQHGQ